MTTHGIVAPQSLLFATPLPLQGGAPLAYYTSM